MQVSSCLRLRARTAATWGARKERKALASLVQPLPEAVSVPDPSRGRLRRRSACCCARGTAAAGLTNKTPGCARSSVSACSTRSPAKSTLRSPGQMP